jgi:hypothetical protein
VVGITDGAGFIPRLSETFVNDAGTCSCMDELYCEASRVSTRLRPNTLTIYLDTRPEPAMMRSSLL